MGAFEKFLGDAKYSQEVLKPSLAAIQALGAETRGGSQALCDAVARDLKAAIREATSVREPLGDRADTAGSILLLDLLTHGWNAEARSGFGQLGATLAKRVALARLFPAVHREGGLEKLCDPTSPRIDELAHDFHGNSGAILVKFVTQRRGREISDLETVTGMARSINTHRPPLDFVTHAVSDEGSWPPTLVVSFFDDHVQDRRMTRPKRNQVGWPFWEPSGEGGAD